MKFTIKKLPKSELELEVTVPALEFNKYIERVTADLGKDLEVEGFRKGKAPQKIVEEKAGKGNIVVEAADLAIRENYLKIIKEDSIEAILEPEIDILKVAAGDDFIFRAKVVVLPEIQLSDYKKIASGVKRNKVLIEESEAEEALNWLRKSRAKFIAKENPAEIGDFVEIEYWSSQLPGVDKEKKQKDGFILGEGHFLGDFEKQLVGMKAGEEKKGISISAPDNHFRKDLAGKTIEMEVKVNSVRKMELPEIDDNFAKSLGSNFKDLNTLKKSVQEGITREKDQKEKERQRTEILGKISLQMSWELPDSLIAEERKKMLEDFKHEVARTLKISFEEYLKQTGKTEKDLEESFSGEAEGRIKNFLILKKIGEKEGISVSPEEINEEMNRILKTYPDMKTAEKPVDQERLKLYTGNALKTEKTLVFLESFVSKN